MNPGKHIQDEIRRVLMENWDPISIRDEPGCYDEYDSYIGGVYGLLASSALDEEIAAHLYRIETDWMGLGTASRHDKLMNVAQALRSINIESR